MLSQRKQRERESKEYCKQSAETLARTEISIKIMHRKTILILGGYGNAGAQIAELLLKETTDIVLILAGRNLERAQAEIEKLYDYKERLKAAYVDATSTPSLKAAFGSVDMVIVASSTTANTRTVMEAALDANIDYYDIQVSLHDCVKPIYNVLRYWNTVCIFSFHITYVNPASSFVQPRTDAQ